MAQVAIAPVEAQAGEHDSAELADKDSALKQRAVSDFEASLRAQSGLDSEGLEFILQNFRQAIDEAPLDPGLMPLDADSWAQTLNGMVANGLIDEDERNVLARQFEQAISPSQGKDAQLALEFARRLQSDGEQSAMEWLATQGKPSRKSSEVPSRDVVADGKQSITKSRSRRLRGPPTAV